MGGCDLRMGGCDLRMGGGGLRMGGGGLRIGGDTRLPGASGGFGKTQFSLQDTAYSVVGPDGIEPTTGRL